MKIKNKFFTLIELIVVIVVIGVLAAIVIPNLSSFKKEAKETAILSDGKVIQMAVDMYQLDNNGSYPIKGGKKPTLGKPERIDFHSLKPKYMRSFPSNQNIYYWVDYNGKIYYSSLDNPTDFKKNETGLSWTSNEKSKGYSLYEEISSTTSSSKISSIKLIQFLDGKTSSFTPEGYSPDKNYFINVVDGDGFEAAPIGEGYTGSKPFNQRESEEDSESQLELGSFVQFGEYNGHPLTWNVVKKEEDSVMLFMTEPIKNTDGTYLPRSFDNAPQSGEPTNAERNLHGSNDWSYSDIRAWLNGSFYNSAFGEKSGIKETTHDYYLASIDKAQATSGSTPHLYNSAIDLALQNDDTAYKKKVMDKVFLVNIEELVNHIKPTLGKGYYSPDYWYFTRDAWAANSYYVRYVYMDGNIYSNGAKAATGRIRPALNLEVFKPISGDGSAEQPYILN